MKKKIRLIEKTSTVETATWKKLSKDNFNFYIGNKIISKANNTFMGKHLIFHCIETAQLFVLKNFYTQPLHKIIEANKIDIDITNGYWYKASNDGVYVYSSDGNHIKKSMIYKYAPNQIDVIFKGETQLNEVVLENYKYADKYKLYPSILHKTNNTKSKDLIKKKDGECIKGDCSNGYGEMKYINGDRAKGFFKNGLPNGPMHTSNKKKSFFTTFNGSFKNQEGFLYEYNGTNLMIFTNKSKNIGFYNDFKIKKAYKLNLSNGKITSSTELTSNGDKGCLVGNCGNGIGFYEYNNGATYLGTFKNNKKDGFGTLFFKSGNQYIGEFYNDNYHGLGTFIWSEYTYYMGMYKNGKYDGQGVLYYNKNKYEAGIWKNGTFVNSK